MKKYIQVWLVVFSLGLMLVGCSTTVDEDIDVTEDVDQAEEEGEEEINISKVPFGSFTALTTQGEEVTEAIFSEYDITMVNIWATWCSPCVNEMDELQEVYAGLDENVNMISICYDGGTETELANEILSGNSAEFIAIIPDDQIMANVFTTIQYFPTTMFVDSEGNILSDYLEGAPSANVVAVYEAYIDAYLEMAGVE